MFNLLKSGMPVNTYIKIDECLTTIMLRLIFFPQSTEDPDQLAF